MSEGKEDRTLEGLRILVVDDEPDARIFISTIVEDHGGEALQAQDGFEALEMVRSENPDLVTLDLGMPGKNGIDVFYEMREDAKLRDIPICIVTGRPEMRKLIYERATAPPPEGYLDKPVKPENLVDDIRRILELGERKRTRRADDNATI